MLLAIWWGSWVLCAAALAALAALICVRAYRRRRDLRDQALVRDLSRHLIIWLDDSSHDISAIRPVAAARPSMIENLLFRTADLVQGDERTRLIALAQALGLQERLLRKLRRGGSVQRRQAAETLVMFEADAVVAALVTALDDRNVAVRLAAARALAGQGRPVPLARLAADPAWFGDSVLIQDLFGKLASYQADDLAMLAVDEKMDFRVRAAAAQAVASAGRYEALPLFLEMASSRHDTLREAAAVALGILAHPRAAATLRSLLRDPYWPVRAAAAEAAGRVASADLAPGLEDALNDENWWVRSRAADALRAVGAVGQAVLSRVAQGPASPARDAAALHLPGQEA
ncbi:HEAT repeat domain-containing protein [Bordetella petrii]|uniref:HEAT repeat domain-containing protein n=1 Tax=Bordetella petrii TaxID=94624 RepID=UPI001A95B147|nr:HEAT repeat domain-containing protein [Bordetella petrii]MBO1114245.1 HEAT repeat domain-containing protein [Bordetella petrii]